MADFHIGTEDILDIGNAYIEDFMPKTWYDAARKYTKSIFATYFLQKGRVKRKTPSEKGTFNIKVGRNEGTRATGFFDKLAPPRTDLFKKGEFYWTWQDSSFLLDIREPSFQRQGAELEQFDYLKGQEQDMFDGFFEKNDEWILSLAAAPNDGEDGHPVPWGLPYMITPSTTAEVGRNGQNPSTYDDKYGIDTSLEKYKGYRNTTFTLSAISDTDGLAKMEKAMRRCDFKSYKKVSPESEPTCDFLILSHPDWFYDYSTYLKTHNDNVQRDGGRYAAGKSSLAGHVYQGVDWIEVEQFADDESLAYDATKPIYGLDLSTIEICTYGDWFMKKKKAIMQTDAPNTAAIVMDSGYNIVLRSARSNFRGRVAA